MPIEGIVLQMKSMNIDAVINFPFPTPPDRASLTKAERILTLLGALEPPAKGKMVNGIVRQGSIGGKITELGRAMSLFPVSPRYAKMLVSGQQHGCLPYVIASVAVLAVGDPFLREEALGKEDEDDDGSLDVEPSPELSLIRSDALRAKEEKRLKRKAFFETQAVRLSLFFFLSSRKHCCEIETPEPDDAFFVFLPSSLCCRSTTRSATVLAISSECSLSLERTNTMERVTSFASRTTFDQR